MAKGKELERVGGALQTSVIPEVSGDEIDYPPFSFTFLVLFFLRHSHF
jgi:hypothetical protein